MDIRKLLAEPLRQVMEVWKEVTTGGLPRQEERLKVWNQINVPMIAKKLEDVQPKHPRGHIREINQNLNIRM